MKALLIFLLVCPLLTRAQLDTMPPVQRNTLKPIGNELVPGGYYNGQYGQIGVRTQYTYDGLDVRRAKDLGPYILASGDPNAIHEFNAYVQSRHTGGWLIAGGSIALIAGAAIAFSNEPGSNGQFTTQQPYVCPAGQVCGTSSGTFYGGQVAGYQTVLDTKRANANATGLITMLGGGILAGIGWGMQMPGRHMRRAVQYYNRSLKQQGISWHVQPYAGWSSSGLGLMGRF